MATPKLLTFLILFFAGLYCPAQNSCTISEDYSSPGSWTSETPDDQIFVGNGQLNFQNATDGKNRRVYRRLNQSVGGDCWKLQFEVEPMAGGVNEVAGHLLLGLTEGNDCPLNTCGSVNTNFTNSPETGILVAIGSPRHSLPLLLRIRSKKATAVQNSNPVEISYGEKYFVQVERLDDANGILSVFSDPAFQQHIAGSPVHFTIQPGIDELNYIQHAAFPQGHPDRKLTATLDNVCIMTNTCQCDLLVDLGDDILRCKITEEELKPLVINPNYNYKWSTGETTASIKITEPGKYFVTADSAGCTASDTILVSEINTNLESLVPSDTTLCDDDNKYLQFKHPGYTYGWPDGSIGTGYVLPGPGLVKYEAYSLCDTFQSTIKVDIIDCDCLVLIPNVFTPNGDHVNDEFLLKAPCEIADYHLQIYNRWGSRVFESSSINQSWKGLVNGREASEGVYLYILNYRGKTIPVERTGFLTLIR